MGHDWNGQIAWSTVIRAPERVKTRSVLSCPNADSVNPTACPQIRKTPGDAHMAIPPNELPEGLSTHEYRRLAALYRLMDRQELALKAMSRVPEMMGLDQPMTDEDKQRMVEFSANLLKAFRRASTEGGDPFAELSSQLTAFGIPEDQAAQFVGHLAQTVKEAKEAPLPPREVPHGLSAWEYYELAQKYKQMGWTEQARAALQFAIGLDGSGEGGQKALRFLRTKIPRNSVPYAAEQRNVLGFNQLCAGDIEGARRTFQALIEECPDFEWPYGNLGSLLIQMGDIDAARGVLHKALSLNPDYTNAWLHLARLHALESDFAAAYECLARVAEIDPDEPASVSIRAAIDDLAAE